MTLSLFLALVLPSAHGGRVEGAVLDRQGRPVPDCAVFAVNPRLEATATSTDEDGHYQLEDLPPGHYRLLASPPNGDNRVARYHPDVRDFCDSPAFSLTTADASATADFSLPEGVGVSGTILDSDEYPISTAGIIAVPLNGPAVQRLGATNEDGTFWVPGLDVADGGASQWAFRVGVSGWPLQWFGQTYDADQADIYTIAAQGTTDVGQHQLLDGIFVQGRITHEDGPIAEGTVRVYSSSQLVQTTTDADGHYEAMGLPPGDILSWVSADGFGVTYYPDADRPVAAIPATEEGQFIEGADLEMPRESIFHGRLVADDARTDFSGAAVLLYNDTHTVGRGAVTDEEGRFFIDQLHGGTYHIFVYASDIGYADAWSRHASGDYLEITVDPETEMREVDIAVPTAVRLEGTVIGEEGVPVVDATVLLTDANAESMAAQAETAHLTHTDSAGAYEVVGLPPGHWKIQVLVDPTCPGDPGYVPIYYPQAVDPLLWEPIEMRDGDGDRVVRFDLPRDDDYDLMSDKWERRYSLDTERDDSTEDPDKDGLTNLEEYRVGLDPRTPEGEWITVRRCGCAANDTSSHPTWWFWMLGLALGRRRGPPTSQPSATHHSLASRRSNNP